MDFPPSILIRNRFDPSQNACWIWKISRIDQNKFETSFDGTNYIYKMNDLFEIINLIATDHVKRHREKDVFIIESNLGFSPFECSGKDLHRHLLHSLTLFAAVLKIEHPPKIQSDYATS